MHTQITWAAIEAVLPLNGFPRGAGCGDSSLVTSLMRGRVQVHGLLSFPTHGSSAELCQNWGYALFPSAPDTADPILHRRGRTTLGPEMPLKGFRINHTPCS